jgi:hypothetical protein
MDTKKVVGVVVILVAVIGLLVVFVGLPATQTEFHYEQAYPVDGTKPVQINLELRNTNISVTFVDDTTLMYRVDVTQYSAGSHHHAYFREWDAPNNYYVFTLDSLTDEGAKEVTIVLGTATNYTMEIDGNNIDASVVFDNGAVLEGQECVVSGSGSFHFELTEDVSFSGSALIDLDLNIDLPSGLNGRLEFPSGVTPSFTTLVGWTHVSTYVYATSLTSEPLLDIEHDSQGSISGSLQN